MFNHLQYAHLLTQHAGGIEIMPAPKFHTENIIFAKTLFVFIYTT